MRALPKVLHQEDHPPGSPAEAPSWNASHGHIQEEVQATREPKVKKAEPKPEEKPEDTMLPEVMDTEVTPPVAEESDASQNVKK